MKVSLVVAVAENGVIGRHGGLPWRLSSDLKAFRRLTLGKPIIMGRKTFQSLRKPLDGRDNIVVTRDPFFEAAGISVTDTMNDALTLGRMLAASRGGDEVMIIGGAEIYERALPLAGRVYLTQVHASPEGDVHFPPLDPAHWREVSRDVLPKGERDEFAATLIVLDRIPPQTAGR